MVNRERQDMLYISAFYQIFPITLEKKNVYSFRIVELKIHEKIM